MVRDVKKGGGHTYSDHGDRRCFFKKNGSGLITGSDKTPIELYSYQGWNLIYKATFYITSVIRNQDIFGSICIIKLILNNFFM